MTGRLTKIHSPLEISSLRGPPPLLAIFCLHPTADLPAVQTTTKPEVLHQGEKQYSFHSLRPNLSWLPHRPHQWCSIEGQGNSLTRPPRCVCWYYWQTVWLCLSECDDRTKHWYLPCDNRRVWTGSVQKRGVWDWQSVCVCWGLMHRICNLCVGVLTHVMIVASVIAFYILALLSKNSSTLVEKIFMFEHELEGL